MSVLHTLEWIQSFSKPINIFQHWFEHTWCKATFTFRNHFCSTRLFFTCCWRHLNLPELQLFKRELTKVASLLVVLLKRFNTVLLQPCSCCECLVQFNVLHGVKRSLTSCSKLTPKGFKKILKSWTRDDESNPYEAFITKESATNKMSGESIS